MTEQTDAAEVAFDEGDEVLLRARVYRANREQALISFVSMDGQFSIRVPVGELARAPPSAPRAAA